MDPRPLTIPLPADHPCQCRESAPQHKGAHKFPDGKWSGFEERFDDFSSVAYWYQTEPHKEFAKMLPVELRLPNP